jgi:hypothetical protein
MYQAVVAAKTAFILPGAGQAAAGPKRIRIRG